MKKKLSLKEKEALRKRLVYFARKHLGKPYKYGAKPWEAPKFFDCSSFTQYLYKRIGIELPRTALEQAHLGKKVNIKDGLEVGDLIFIKGGWGHYDPKFPQGIGHVAIYVGDGKVIHAKWKKNKDGSDDGKVEEWPVEKLLKRKDLVVIKRIL
jgi:cell wall-associated NlpC family hydrolase